MTSWLVKKALVGSFISPTNWRHAVDRVLDEYRRIFKGLLAKGATDQEAHALAAQLAVKNAELATNVEVKGLARLRELKSAPDSKTYAYRGEVLRVSEVRVAKDSKGNDQLKLRICCRVDNTDQPLALKADQAFRVLSLLILKFQDTERDIQGGFDMISIAAKEDELEAKFRESNFKLSMSSSSTVTSELNRAIRDKARSSLKLDRFLGTVGDRYRLEFAPGSFVFQPSALKLLNQLSDDAIDKWFDQFGLSMREAS